MQQLTIALAGNPNCGKTTLFNELTGSRQRVGNWPGVTVERIEGLYRHEPRDGSETQEVKVVDLPGIYSFSAYSLDESIARQFILQGKPAVVVNCIDASNLERNLYLTTQLLEMKAPVVVALNMMDIARQRRIRIEVEHLARHLGCPVVPVVASRGRGIDELQHAVASVAREHPISPTRVQYDPEVERALDDLTEAVADCAAEFRVDPRWLAVKLLEGDDLAREYTGGQFDGQLERHVRKIEKHVGEDIDIVVVDGRYGFIHGLARDVVHRADQVRRTVTDAVDKVLLNRLIGIPAFLLVMFGVFQLTLDVGSPFIEFFDALCGTLFVDGVRHVLVGWSSPPWLTALLADGVGGGIQMVSTFIPPIFFIFLCLSILEDSGYMARAAFVMDRLMRAIGLPGKAFLPMLVGFGCNVPAILSTRTLEHPRDRIMTVLMNPFMSCGARLPVYTLFAAAFFPRHAGLMVFGIYMTGVVLGILTGLMLKTTVLRGEATTFVMELPPYHIPTLRGIAYHTWHKLKGFILRAGKVIILAILILSMLNHIRLDESGPTVADEAGGEATLLARAGRGLQPAFSPMGIRERNWPAAVGLLTGLFAKEVVIATLDTLYTQQAAAAPAATPSTGPAERAEPSADVPADETDGFELWAGIRDAFAVISRGFSSGDKGEDAEPAPRAFRGAMAEQFDGRIGALAYCLFVLIYAPCIAAIAAIYRETNLRWTLFAVTYLTALAWVVATAVYQAGRLPQQPGVSAAWVVGCLGGLGVFYVLMRLAGRKLRPVLDGRLGEDPP
jgi:ferrous iron transport protein B